MLLLAAGHSEMSTDAARDESQTTTVLFGMYGHDLLSGYDGQVDPQGQCSASCLITIRIKKYK